MGSAHWKSKAFWLRAAMSFAFRLACYDAMVFMALLAESRAAPTLPDVVLNVVPYVEWVSRYNYLLWLAAYLPIAVLLLFADGPRFIRYMVTSGLLALLRGVCIWVTGLGPVHGPDSHAGMSADQRWAAFTQLVTPRGFFDTDAGARIYLTKDLFFSGHTATTCLLLLYVWRLPKLRAVMLPAHVLIVVSVFLAHLHYTIDVIGAYAVTLALFALREGRLGASDA